MKTYNICYRMQRLSQGCKRIDVCAKNRFEAYDKAVYETIPRIEGEAPYSAWVNAVTYRNGNRKEFDTCEGKPY